jgi:type I restriction enzyme S subunit
MTGSYQKRLGDVLSLEYGKSLPEEERDSSGSCVVAGSNGPQGWHSTCLVKGPGIVVGRKGSAGRVNWFAEDFWPIDTTYYVVPKMKLNLRWLYWCLRAARLTDFATATGVPGLNRNDVYDLPITVPDTAEQKRVSDTVDEVEKMRQLRTKAEDRMRDVLPATFDEMFGLGAKGRDEWPIKKVKDTVNLINGRAFGPNDWGQEGLPIIRIQNLKDPRAPFNYFSGTAEKKFHVSPGDILVSWAGQLVSFGVYLWKGPAGVLNQHIFRVEPKMEFTNEFLCEALSHIVESAKTNFQGSEMKHLTKGTLDESRFRYPPMSLQKEFSQRVAAIRSLEKDQATSRQRLDDLSVSLLQESF